MPVRYLDLGNSKWRKRWISKQNLIEFSRCPYRVYVAFSEEIPIGELKETRALQAILTRGLYLESQAVKAIKPLQVVSQEEVQPLSNKRKIIQIPTIIRNHEIGIRGIPDLIDTANGAFIPYEIKSHSQVQPSDQWELAFYWLLLEPLRTKRAKPRGYVILSDMSTARVDLPKDLLIDVEMTIDDIRQIETYPPQPTLGSECKLCQLRKECTDHIVKKGGLSIIHNISYRRQSQFQTLGIKNIAQLAKADPERLNSKFKTHFGNTPGEDELFRMRCHALAYKNRQTYFFGNLERLTEISSKPALVIDLEYSCPGLIWLVGCAVKNKSGIRYQQYFAEKPTQKEEHRILGQFAEFLRKHDSYMLITYSGISADIPQFENACARGSLSQYDLRTILRNHVDLCDVLKRNLRFPMKSFELDSLEKYIGISRQSPIINGLEADSQYHSFLMSKDPTNKDQLRLELLGYNKEDIQSTVEIIARLPQILKDSVAYRG